MNAATTDYPAGDLRVGDADRDRAVRELTDAFEVGRITSAEFDQRCGQALAARTGQELTAVLADLPRDRGVADSPAVGRCRRSLGAWIVIGTSAAAAVSLGAQAVTNALSSPAVNNPAAERFKREVAQQALARMGLKVPLPPASALPAPPGFDWVGTITPAAIAVLLVTVLVVVLRRARASGRRCRTA